MLNSIALMVGACTQQRKKRVNRASRSKRILTKRVGLPKRIMFKNDFDKKGRAGKKHSAFKDVGAVMQQTTG